MLNPKGGSGKTTVATNLAAYFAWQGSTSALMDCDAQGSSTRWLERRPEEFPIIHGIAANKLNLQATRSWQRRAPPGTRNVVVDTSAAIRAHRLIEFTRGADAILIPVGPSDIDIDAAADFISDLLLVAKDDRRAGRIGVIANRVRERTIACRKLMRFLQELVIPVVGVLRDSQNYLHAVAEGKGIHEYPPYRVRKDIVQWESLIRWLETRSIAPVDVEEAAVPSGRPLGVPVNGGINPRQAPGAVADDRAPLRIADTIRPSPSHGATGSESAGASPAPQMRYLGS